jgi:uncharacterized protein YfaS (alpha-2-macroglobulin family)
MHSLIRLTTLVLAGLLTAASIPAARAQNPPPSAAVPPPAAGASVESFSPTGHAKQVRQVSVRFNAAMVALGDPRLPDPFDVACPQLGKGSFGKGRWADDRNWEYDFDEDLPAGITCRFVVRAGLASAAGAHVTGKRRFLFDTGGPTISTSLPYEGRQDIDEEQIFLLKLDAPADWDTVRTHAYCAVEGLAERIPVEVLSGAARVSVLAQRKALGYDYLHLLWKSGMESDVRVRDRSLEQSDDEIAAVRCQRRLPPATQVRLNWGAGIATRSGLETSSDQQLSFRVRPAFTAEVECTRTNSRAGCIPVAPIMVNFSAPLPRDAALAVRLRAGDGTLFSPTAADDGAAPTLTSVSFAPPFPESSSLEVGLPPDLRDDAGRQLENASRFPLEVRVDAYPPLAKFSGTFGILEVRTGGILPVTVRNLEPKIAARAASIRAKVLRLADDPATIADWLRRVERADEPSGEWVDAAANARVWHETTGTQSVFGAADSAVDLNIAGATRATQVIGIPLRTNGFYVVELQSRALGNALLGRDAPRYVSTSALVTDLAVHFKWGREASRVWVTHLHDGSTVAGAAVVISDYCSGAEVWQGRTGRDGIAVIDTALGEPQMAGGCRGTQHPLMALAKQGDDFSFSLSTWNQGITPYEFSLPVGSGYSAQLTHSVLDRALFRAGETVSMKHYLRLHVLTGIVAPQAVAGPHEIKILHQGSGDEFSMTAAFDAGGTAQSQWTIPPEAKLGLYSISIDDRPSGQFKVEQFRLPTMRGSIDVPARPLVGARNAALDLHVAYLAGGGASGLQVKVRSVVEPKPLSFSDYPDYQFGGEALHEGIRTSGNGPADLDFEDDGDADSPGEASAAARRAQLLPATLDAAGSARVEIGPLPALDVPAQLTAELEYADANGEILTTTGHVRLLPAAVALGIRPEGWVASPTQIRFRVIALDLNGKPQAQQRVGVSLYRSTAYSYRKRLIGGFYAYETTREVKKLAASCGGLTDAQGLLTCEVAPDVSGQVFVRAETRDAQGRLAGATASMWVAGKDAWWFGGTSGDRMDLLPEQKEYQAGDTARFQVRMPFRAATALVTVEREGILSSFVTRLEGHQPIVEVPITGNYSPNVFVSVLAVRGRIAHADTGGKDANTADEVTALVDLNKPAYRLGLAQIKVGWRAHRLDVKVAPQGAVYRVRDQVPVKVHVAAADGSALPAGTEVAVAAVDEALLDLAPNTSWDLLDSMMGERGLEVWTSTAQMQVVGKRHYGRKAEPHGGGGGREGDRARELFDSLLFWKSRVVLDAAGDASLTIPLNDSLSSFRIVAVAQAGADRFGTGSATIRTTQDIVLLSALPPVVREGDDYTATFTVRNTTERPITALITATVTPSVPPAVSTLAAQRIELEAGHARDVSWRLSVPFDTAKISWDVAAADISGPARDHLQLTELVTPALPVRTYQATIAQLSAPLSWPAARPAAAIPGRGGLEVTMQSTLAASLDGVREYMRRYPYICFEQQASQAISLRDHAHWDSLMRRLPAYMDGDGLLKYFPSDNLQGDDTLTAYVLSIAQEAGWLLPDADRSRMLHALAQFAQGRLVRGSALPTADLSIRKLAAIDALARYQAADGRMLDSINLEPNLWPTSALIDWVDILQRVPQLPDAGARARTALGILRARLNFQGTTLGFSTEHGDALWWLMISADSNANRLLLQILSEPDWRSDVPRLVRGALGRQQFGHWNTTLANAWGVLAMEKFSTAFESTPVSGTSLIRYASAEQRVSWPQATGTARVSLPWSEEPGRLTVVHEGSGAPWTMVRATAALPLDRPLSSGFKIERSMTAVEQATPGKWSRGDVARVHLELDAQTDMSWVVVDDPIPSGSTILGSGIGAQSQLLARGDARSGWAWPAFEERTLQGFRAYYRFVPKGHWSVDYTVRFNNPGTFVLPSTRVEAMYAPEMLGELPNATLRIEASAGISP